MTQLDDVKALLTDVLGRVDGVATEVADLIAKLTTVPPPTDLTEVVQLATQIQDKLKAIPPEP